MLPALPDYRLWNSPRNYRALADAMIQEVLNAGASLEDAGDNPIRFVEEQDDISVIFHKLPGAKGCNVQARYDPNIDPPAIYVHESGNFGRDNFSILHELAHHQQRVGDAWLDATDMITDRDFTDKLKEKVANSFAARLLISDDLIDQAFGSGEVTAAGVRWIFENSQASMNACLMRCLELDGNRVVMQARTNGTLLYSQGNSDELFPPHRDQPQESIAHAYADLQASPTGSTKVHGGHGIQHRSGKVFPNVVLDMALCDGCVLVVGTLGNNARFAYGDGSNYYTCPECFHRFELAESPGRCRNCNDPKCSQCKGCACASKPATICTRCFVALAVADVDDGRTTHKEC